MLLGSLWGALLQSPLSILYREHTSYRISHPLFSEGRILLSSEIFELWGEVLFQDYSAAELERASRYFGDFALQLLVSKARDENNRQLFNVGELAELRNELPASVVEALLLQLIGDAEEEEEEDLDFKSSEDGAVEGSEPAKRTVRRRKVE